ncbi:MAG TPA: polysaccharide deacetylase family protein [Chloroflexia bacterium]|jgi:peptidoglycan/xylan/chitin deacetylase (PgdA/CDA1 family)
MFTRDYKHEKSTNRQWRSRVMTFVLLILVAAAFGTQAGTTPAARASQATKTVYLTFDDGPHPKYTPQVLDLLTRYNARATFFVIGQSAQAYPKLLQAEIDAGHALGNHTFTHRSFLSMNRAQFQEEVLSTQRVLGDAATTFIRPPGGAINARSRGFAEELGLQVVLWDIDPRDWSRPGASAISSHVLQRVKTGSIVLLHDGGGDRSQTVAALETILAKLSAQGYAFETLPQSRK